MRLPSVSFECIIRPEIPTLRLYHSLSQVLFRSSGLVCMNQYGNAPVFLSLLFSAFRIKTPEW